MKDLETRLEVLSQENSDLRVQVAALKQRCAEDEEALDAIRSGSVDALVIYGAEGEQVYTIQGAEQPYRILIESINEGAATLIEDGTILYCNSRFAEMLMTPLETIIGSTIHQYISPEDKSLFSTLLVRALKSSCRDEVNLQCGDGSSLPIMASLNSFNVESGSGVCLVASDLTERKKVEEQVRQEARRAATLSAVSNSLVGAGLDDQAIIDIIARSAVLLIGDVCVIRLVSEDRQWLNLAGHYHPDPLVQRTFEEVLSKVALRTDEGINGQVFRTGEAVQVTAEQLNGPTAILNTKSIELFNKFQASNLLIVPIRTRSQIIGTLALVGLAHLTTYSKDEQSLVQSLADQLALAITNAHLYIDLQIALQKEQTMRQQLIQSEKLAALSRMLATVVHEINNPMQAIKNWMYLAKMEAPEASSLAEYLDMAATETDRISKLVATLRVFYRKPEPEPMLAVDLLKILNDVRLLLAVHAQDQNFTWQQENPVGSVWVRGIADPLKQVFLNICLNAIEAMQPDGDVIHISVGSTPDQCDFSVAIKNSGPGIAPENLSRIFEPFFTTKPTGSGLGLAVCYEIIQQHHGRISAESQPGEGATFTVWLPKLENG